MRLSFCVNAPPVPKARARVMAGYAFTPKRVRDYEKLVAQHALEARPAGWPLDSTYRVFVAVYRAQRRGDLDNFLKAITDALNKGVAYSDDSRIVELHGVMNLDREDPRVMVEVHAA